eukprot:scaffold23639_cov65-Phaeocystis_antarctica.AAC.2
MPGLCSCGAGVAGRCSLKWGSSWGAWQPPPAGVAEYAFAATYPHPRPPTPATDTRDRLTHVTHCWADECGLVFLLRAGGSHCASRDASAQTRKGTGTNPISDFRGGDADEAPDRLVVKGASVRPLRILPQVTTVTCRGSLPREKKRDRVAHSLTGPELGARCPAKAPLFEGSGMVNGADAVARLDNWFWTPVPPGRDALIGEIFDDPPRRCWPDGADCKTSN